MAAGAGLAGDLHAVDVEPQGRAVVGERHVRPGVDRVGGRAADEDRWRRRRCRRRRGSKGPLPLLALRKYASTSRCTMVRQPLCAAVGWIHASSVMAAPRFSDAELGHAHQAVDAVEAQRAAEAPCGAPGAPPLIVPVLPLPEASAMVVPAPSLNA